MWVFSWKRKIKQEIEYRNKAYGSDLSIGDKENKSERVKTLQKYEKEERGGNNIEKNTYLDSETYGDIEKGKRSREESRKREWEKNVKRMQQRDEDRRW